MNFYKKLDRFNRGLLISWLFILLGSLVFGYFVIRWFVKVMAEGH